MNLNTLNDQYSDLETVKLPKGLGKGYRSDAHGLALEVKGHRVTAIALYPPVKE